MPQKKMKQVFIVDGAMEIHPLEISASDWEKEVFTASLEDGQPIVAKRSDSTARFITYIAFETEAGAVKYQDAQKLLAGLQTQATCDTGRRFPLQPQN